MQNRIALIGTTGNNSKHWTESFLNAGWSVRSLMRDPTRLAPRPNQTAERFDLDDAGTYERALADADVLGLVTPPDLKQIERETALIWRPRWTRPRFPMLCYAPRLTCKICYASVSRSSRGLTRSR